MRNQAQQAMLDAFFGSLGGDGDGRRGVSDRGFAKARDRLQPSCLGRLNTFLVQQADALGLLPRWCGLRVVAADASVLMPAIRPCHTLRRLAGATQQLFSLLLPGVDLTLHASVHGPEVAERQMLFEALEHLGPDDVLVLDRGYPAAWLVAHLNEKGFRFCMRCDKGNGWVAMRAFLRSGADDALMTLVGVSGRVAGQGCPNACGQYPSACQRPIPAATEPALKTPSSYGLQGLRLKFGGLPHQGCVRIFV